MRDISDISFLVFIVMLFIAGLFYGDPPELMPEQKAAMTSRKKQGDASMISENDLRRITEKVNWSGYDREDGRKIILSLVGEIRRMRAKEPEAFQPEFSTHCGIPNCS